MINTSLAESDALIAKWLAYNFTDAEKRELKGRRLPPDGTEDTVTIGDRTVNTGIMWNPNICDKARIVGIIVYPTNDFGWRGRYSKDEETLISYYGLYPYYSDYVYLNTNRKAELIILADKIVDLESFKNKTY
jgi:hypothetical protein